MNKSTNPRKIDRRTLYTRSVIKDALLELLEEKTFDKITVSSVCKQAEITRATFYLHYDNLSAVLDELLDEALMISEENAGHPAYDVIQMLNLILRHEENTYTHSDDSLLPACQRIANHPKYKAIFKDETLSAYIIKKIYSTEKKHMLPILMEKCNLSQKEADKIFILIIYGVFAVNKSLNWEKNNEWYHLQSTVSKFILGGLKSFIK